MARPKRHLAITRVPSSTTGVDVVIGQDVTAFSLRVVDAARLPVEFEVRRKATTNWDTDSWSVDEGEPWTEDELCLEEDLELVVRSDATTERIELLTWTA